MAAKTVLAVYEAHSLAARLTMHHKGAVAFYGAVWHNGTFLKLKFTDRRCVTRAEGQGDSKGSTDGGK